MEEDLKKIIKVVVTGPESTGKTSLSQSLASHFGIEYVPEHARDFLEQQKGEYTKDDLTLIAKGQIQIEDKYLKESPNLVICDTSLEVIRVWSEWKYSNCDPFILQAVKTRSPDLYLLLSPDIAWEPDPLRENPHDREALFTYYQKSLREYPSKVIELRGTKLEKLASAIDQIQRII